MFRIIKLYPLLAFALLLGCTRGRTAATPLPGLVNSATPVTLPRPSADAGLPVTVTPFVEPLATETETLTPTPIPLTIDPTYLNFPTNTPTATLDPSLILLRIVSPGPMSKVVSPIDFIVHVAPEYTGTTRIELIGEDGTELYRKVFKTYSNIGYYTRVAEKINYEIKGAAEIARLQVSTLDSKGRVQAHNSVRLLLQAVGENEFSPPYAVQDRILLRYPHKNDEITGGTLPVTGDFQPANDLPITLELTDIDGAVLGSRQLQLAPADGKYQQFTTTIPYSVNQKTPVRLIIRQADDRIDGLSYLYSTLLLISP